MTIRTPRWLPIALAVWGAAAAGVAAQQVERATIRGVVRGPDGAPVARASVIVTDLEAEADRETVTDDTGAYVLGGLLPGRYRLRVEAPGLPPGSQDAFELAAGESRTVDFTLGGVPTAPGGAPATPPVQALPPPRPPPPRPQETMPDYVPAPDRWRLEFPLWQRYPRDLEGEYPYVRSRLIDPYNQNVLKGDYPIIGQSVFFVMTAISELPVEYRKLPTPSGVSAQRPGSQAFFGEGEQLATLPTAITSFELFRGDTAFRPRDWAVRVTPVFNVNYVNTRERNVVDATPEEGKNRRREDFALQEAFGEVKLFDVGPNFDFVSVRAGIQPFTSDFRGFLFRDTNLGVRAFGNWGSNRNQWNVAYFDQLEKETNSELNLLERRSQRVFVANYYRQDFLTRGYTLTASVHANIDEGEETFFDANGFLVRPAPIGLIVPHAVRAYYAGVGGDGHVGRLNLTHQFYWAFGKDEFNGIAGREVDIDAQFAVVELSIDKDWQRLKGTFLWASGDGDPEDDTARGFDAILDNPNIAGGPFSFWNRQGIRLTQTLVGLTGRSSVLPSLRSSKAEGQPSFVNPGLFLYGAGYDAEITQKLRATANVNYLRFHHTEPLRTVLFQDGIPRQIGVDYGVGVQYRPFLNDNVVITGGAAFFTPGKGFEKLLTGDTLYTPFVVLTLTY